MCTPVPGFQSFYRFFALFGFGKLAISSIRVKAQEVATYAISMYPCIPWRNKKGSNKFNQ